MNIFRIYIKPFLDDGTRGEYIEVTDDVDLSALQKISSDLDNTEFDIGVLRFSNFSLKINNLEGKYGDVDEPTSIFRYKRSGSLVKVTWRFGNPPICGVARTDDGFFTGEETTLFEGILSDDGTVMNASDHMLNFTVLGKESIFKNVIVPFGSISNGDLLSEVIYACLNQSAITELLTVSLANIVPGLDQEIDSIASLQNKTVQEGLNKLLLAGNSVLYIDDGVIKVRNRDADAESSFSFYGAGSFSGPENIIDLSDIQNGTRRIFNFVTWKNTSLSSSSPSSILKNGYKKRELDFEFFTDNTKRQNILDEITGEFADPKQEFKLRCRLYYDTFVIQMLDRVLLDYPPVPTRSDEPVAIYGVSQYNDAVYPGVLYTFQIAAETAYKVIGKSVDTKDATITFRLRKI